MIEEDMGYRPLEYIHARKEKKEYVYIHTQYINSANQSTNVQIPNRQITSLR